MCTEVDMLMECVDGLATGQRLVAEQDVRHGLKMSIILFGRCSQVLTFSFSLLYISCLSDSQGRWCLRSLHGMGVTMDEKVVCLVRYSVASNTLIVMLIIHCFPSRAEFNPTEPSREF